MFVFPWVSKWLWRISQRLSKSFYLHLIFKGKPPSLLLCKRKHFYNSPSNQYKYVIIKIIYSYYYLLKAKTVTVTVKHGTNKKIRLKLACIYFLWKVKDVAHNFTFFLNFTWQVGELSRTCTLLGHCHSHGKEIDSGSALARRKDCKYENMSHYIWYFPWIEHVGVLDIMKQLQ